MPERQSHRGGARPKGTPGSSGQRHNPAPGPSRERDGQRGDQGSRRGGRWGYKRLEALCSMGPEEILHTLANSQTGYSELMEQDLKDKPDWVALMLANSVKACTCDTIPASLMQFLNTLRNSKFLNQGLSMYLSSMPLEVSPSRLRRLGEPIRNVITLLLFLLERMPNSLAQLMPIIAVVDYVVNSLQDTTSAIDDNILSMRQDLLRVRDVVMEDNKKGARQKQEDPSGEHKATPPDNFRSISVFPGKDDIMRETRPFLRKNKVKGSYKDIDHYLDVHFRLLKEDLVSPLRDSIAAYLKMDEEHANQVQTLKDMRLYHDVIILHPVCTNEGIAYRIQFNISRLQHIRWESSKRLIYGSLVCLSADNFGSSLFAAVTNRDRKLLQKGQVDIQCSREEDANMLQLQQGQRFLMAETTSYFEAYKHVLTGLQEITAESFPFQSYIVDSKSSAKTPQYLQQAQFPVYDLQCLVKQEVKSSTAPEEKLSDEEPINSDADDDEDEDEEQRFLLVPVMEATQWPSADKLSLDPSQHRALRSALTREMALIQGPPGTGKTFIGLKIVETLLKNKIVWNPEQLPEDDKMSPILVVCYTNHALDQFLEGIHVFERKGIIRVGGRSKSVDLEDFTIRSLRRKYRDKKVMPKMVYDARVDSVKLLDTLKSGIEKAVAQLEAIQQGILNEDALYSAIPEEMWEDLQSRMKPSQQESTTGAYGLASMIIQWLQPEKSAAKIKVQAEHQVFTRGQHVDPEAVEVEEEAMKIIEQRTLEEEEEEEDNKYQNDQKIRHRLMMQNVVADLAVILDSTITANNNIKPDKNQQMNTALSQKVLAILKTLQPMPEEESTGIDNIWDLKLEDRWRLYKYWLELHKQIIAHTLSELAEQYHMASDRLKELLFQEDLFIMRCASVIGMTTTAAARYRSLLQTLKPKIIVVEEAAEVLEAHIITTLSAGCQHLVMIGDHKQLRPNPTVYELAESYKLKISLFERLVLNGIECVTLERQHRMRPEFASLLHHIYPDLQDADNVLGFDAIQGVSRNLFFISHEQEESIADDGQSKVNVHEAKFVVRLCQYLMLQGYSPSQITILTPYTGQLFEMRKLMPKDIFMGVRACAVDNFQGEENDIILLSLVRSNAEGKCGFVGENNRICVAMSRARKGFFVIGNFKMLAEKSRLWDKIIKSVQEQGCYGTALPLVCLNHPESGIMAAKGSHFDKAPEGGCMRPCDTRLSCGHVCERACHSYDREHKEYRCLKPCRKFLCPQKHQCPKRCYEECGPCKKDVVRVMADCGHKQRLKCHVAPFQYQCQEVCTFNLPCGHMCTKKCGEPHTQACPRTVVRTLTCGHKRKMLCHERPSQDMCEEKCTKLLQCEHPCSGSCGSCVQGRLHKACTSDCGRTLVCGHQCSATCTKDCPACTKPCENRCVHSRCHKSCGLLCAPCKEPCAWSCPHRQCSKLCSEPCDRPRCQAPCKDTLPCGHPCIGMCGETCPAKCRVCNKEEVEEILFGSEDEPDSRFVELEDCGHVIEVESLDQWMDGGVDMSQGSIDIKLKECPKCKTPIRRNLRYGSLINMLVNSIEAVKEKIIGGIDQIEATKEQLKHRLYSTPALDKTIQAVFQRQLHSQDVTMESLSCIENCINFSETLTKYKDRVYGARQESKENRPSLKRMVDHFDISVTHMMTWTKRNRKMLSEQEAEDAKMELTRLKYLVNLLELKAIQLGRGLQLTEVRAQEMQQIEGLLTEGWHLSTQRDQFIKDTLLRLENEIPRSGLGISDEERIQIVNAIGLSKGHWYKCPNGHIYAIGECGGATMTAKCPDCNRDIGGTRHQLLQDNALAAEMDGASAPAWPPGMMY